MIGTAEITCDWANEKAGLATGLFVSSQAAQKDAEQLTIDAKAKLESLQERFDALKASAASRPISMGQNPITGICISCVICPEGEP